MPQTVNTVFSIAHAEEFPLELGRSPKNVRNAYQRTVIPALRSRPDQSDPPRIKKLTGYKDLWRLRISDDYRLVYRVDKKARTVTMLMLDHRAKIYGRLGANADGKPGVRIVARAAELLEKEPTPTEIGHATFELSNTLAEQNAPVPDQQLSQPLDPELLTNWGVPVEYHKRLLAATTEGELLALAASVPEEMLERVLSGLWPKKIEEVVQQPVRIAVDQAALDVAADGNRSLESFLLNLDEDQKEFVARFEGVRPKGPWLLKGGPGSGKSTVALYCIRELIHDANARLPLGEKPLRILFTTFTKSLTNASRHLLAVLKVEGGKHCINVKTVDSLALAHLHGEWQNMRVENEPITCVSQALSECIKADPKFSFPVTDAEFLFEEIDWVIVGQGLNSVEEYVKATRAGRGRGLGESQRRQVWQLFDVSRRLMRQKRVCLFSERLQKAAEQVKSAYDYVFIDEAQDLKPVAIRFCIGLCHKPDNVFLTADTNQSIYGNGLSWSKVASDLRFQGKARILRRNYRTTTEIWTAITQLAPKIDADRETLDVETVYRGPFPILARYSQLPSLGVRLNAFLFESLRQERVAPGAAAVLCPTEKEIKIVLPLIDQRFNPKAMKSSDMDLQHPGVKVITMHAAKGLQFPVVAVVGVEAGVLPWPSPKGIDVAEHDAKQQRLLFVACSRAMRRLIVFANREHPSPFVAGLNDKQWEIEDLCGRT